MGLGFSDTCSGDMLEECKRGERRRIHFADYKPAANRQKEKGRLICEMHFKMFVFAECPMID